jgi:nucleoside-diphosphate-sugar epimerase
MRGVSAVVNCVMGPPAAMIATARTLSETSLRLGISRFVHFSSIAVYGDAAGLVREDSPLGAGVDWYGAAKITCEEVVAATAGRGLSTMILRPGLIHGPGSALWTLRIGRLLRHHRLGDLGPAGDGWCNLIHVQDVANAALAAVDAPLSTGGPQIVNLSDRDPPRWNRYLMDFAFRIGATPVRRIPGWQLSLDRKFFAPPLKVVQIVSGRLGLADGLVPDPITPGLSRLFGQNVRYCSETADRILAFERTPYDRAIQDAASWMMKK